MEENKNIEKLVSEATIEAKEKLKNIMTEKMLGYNYYLNLSIKNILKEKYNIDWEPISKDSEQASID